MVRSPTKSLQRLSDAILIFLDALDAEMKKPESRDRGSHVAKLCNWLDVENDGVRFSDLGVNFRHDDKARATATAKRRRKIDA